MLVAWSEASSEPDLKAGIGRFLLAVDEIEDDTKAVVGILAAALGAPGRSAKAKRGRGAISTW